MHRAPGPGEETQGSAPAPPPLDALEVGDPFSTVGADAISRRVPLSAVGFLGAWALLGAGLCYLVATQLPGKPLSLFALAVVVAGLGALLGFALTAERRAGNRRLASELRRASAILRSIEAVTDPGLAFLDLDELLAAVLSRTKDAIGGDVVAVLLTERGGANLRVRASQGATQLAPAGSAVQVGEGVLGMAAQRARPVVVPDARHDDSGSLPGFQAGLASIMAAPLIVHGSTLGVVEVGSLRQRTFGSSDLRLLQVVADRLAALVERARLDDLARRSHLSSEQANMHLRILARGSTVLGTALESYEDALRELGGVVVPEFADWFGAHVLEENGRLRRVVARPRASTPEGHTFKRAGNPHPSGEDLVAAAIAERRAQLVVPTARLDSEAFDATIHTPETLGDYPDVSSLLVVPVQVRGVVVATLSFATWRTRRGYRPSDLQTAKELADRVAVTIERVRSWRAAKRAEEMAVQYAERLRRLVDASLVLNSPFRADEVLQLLAEHIQRALGADAVVVSTLSPDGPLAEKLVPAASGGRPAVLDESLRGVVLAASDLVASSGQVVRRPDEWEGSARSGTPESPVGPVGMAVASAALRVRGWVAAPVTDTTGAVRRVVVAAGPPGSQFSLEDESVLTLFAQMASVALRNAALYGEVVENEQRLQTLVDASPLAIAEVDARAEAQWWNRAAAELFGWPDRSVARRIPVRTGSELVLAGLVESAYAGKPIIGVAMPVMDADGESLELSVSASPIGPPGAVAGVLVVAEDVTERQRMLEQFNQAERLNAMSRMAGAVAHDFNNLLTVILGCSDVLMRRLSDDEELGPDVAAIHRAGTRAASLTNQLVRIGGQQHPVEPEVVEIDEVLAAMHPILAGVLGDGVRLELVAGEGRATVLIDRSELERAILNLAINARDAMPAGGTLRIETSRVASPHEPGAGVVQLVFADTGVGMDEATAARCFEPFFTTKGRARGTGLGLAATHAAVLQAGGDVRVETSPGTGARFTITFPPAAPDAAARERREPPECNAGGHALAAPTSGPSGTTLLVVDDEAEVLRLEVRELRAAGYEVLGAANASEALHLLNARGGAVDLLVTDVVMPGMNGIELATAVRWRYPEVGILFVSGHLDEDATLDGPLPGHAELLAKPFGPDELTSRVREGLARAHAASVERRRKQAGDVPVNARADA